MRQGIWIPSMIEGLENLSLNEKVILSEILSLSKVGGCFASNLHFAKLLKLKEDSISRLLSRLKKKGYIEQTGFDGRKRYLSPLLDALPKQSRAGETEAKKLIRPSLPFEADPGLEEKSMPCTKSTFSISSNNQIKEKLKNFSKGTRIWLERIIYLDGKLPPETPSHIIALWNQLNLLNQKFDLQKKDY